MASQRVFIDLVDSEVEHQDCGSHQDKIIPFEASMESMERKIDQIRGLVVDFRNSSDVPPGFLESMSKSHSAAPVYTIVPPYSLPHSYRICKRDQPKHGGIPNSLSKDFDLNKHCAFHASMQGHDTDECRHLREEIQKLIRSGRILQRTFPQLV
ncbi:hypothetical protein HAX54_009722 [Datura stramonium]|uniref:Uncharacterized protein n=1 Tax=Datura stramonium TaxID=4076 RepID=A0ABS8WXJ6_DATST|nr:hypothetical protein [Datura stramonium]